MDSAAGHHEEAPDTVGIGNPGIQCKEDDPDGIDQPPTETQAKTVGPIAPSSVIYAIRITQPIAT